MTVFAHRYLKYRDAPQVKPSMPVLWPVHVRRVMYPVGSGTQINLFQKAVLGLVRARSNEPGHLAKLLGLHLELVRLIIAQCMSQGWLDDNMRLTDSGLSMLASEEDRHERLRQGVIFQDGISGAVWPRLADSLEEIEALPDSGFFPAFLRNRSSGRKITPFCLSGRTGTNAFPQPSEIQDAWRNYRLDYRNATQLLGSGQLPEQIRIHSIEVMDETAEPMYLLTWICPNPGGSKPWLICDPFDIRERAFWLEEPLEAYLASNVQLGTRMASVLGMEYKVNEGGEISYEAMEHSLELEILTEYSWINRHPDIGHFYRTLKWRLMEVDRGARYSTDSTLTDAQRLAESVLQWLIGKWKPDATILPNAWQQDRRQKVELLNGLDLPAFTPDVIRRLAGQDLKTVRRAIDDPKQSLKALLFAAALATPDNPEHPLRKIPVSALAFERLLDLADSRNKVAHASTTRVNKDTAVSFADFTLGWALLFKEWL